MSRRGKGPYAAHCPECGKSMLVDAAWKARHLNAGMGACLQCIRRRTGWKHEPTCTLARDHAGACPAEAPE